MEHKQAADILIKLSQKNITPEEKEAVLLAVGVLAWTQLAQSRIKNLKTKREKKSTS